MVKHFLLATAVAAAASVCAQETTTVPTRSEMMGDYILLNSRSYEGVKSLAEMKQFSISEGDNDSIHLSDFYMNMGMDFNATYDESTGTISITAGTPILDMETYMFYLYPWNDETEEVITRPIEYKYTGADTWYCGTTIMLVGIQGENIAPYYFSEGSQIARCNATSNNTSHTVDGETGNQETFVESRSAYVTIVGNTINIYNVLQADQYGYGVRLTGTIDREAGEVWFGPTLTGQSNDGTYRLLTGCEYDEETNLPTGVTNPDTQTMGWIHATIDLEKGEIALDPMTIWPATYSTDGQLTVDETRFYEFVKTVTVTYDVDKTDVSAIETPRVDNTVAKEVSHIDYYAIDGRKLAEPQEGSLVIKVTVYTDGSRKADKIVYLNR